MGGDYLCGRGQLVIIVMIMCGRRFSVYIFGIYRTSNDDDKLRWYKNWDRWFGWVDSMVSALHGHRRLGIS